METLLARYIFKFKHLNKPILFGISILHKNKVYFQTKAEHHFFKCEKTESELIEEIIENITYKSDNFIVTSKPYGLEKKNSNIISQNYSKNYYIEDLLPQIANKLGYNSLTLVKAPEKYSSGVMFLSISNAESDKIFNRILDKKKNNLNTYTFLAITQYPIVVKQLETKLGLHQVKDDTKMVPTIIEKWSKKQVKKKEIKTFQWKHKVIAESNLASLVEINLNLNKGGIVKLMLATKCYSPVLGDELFAYRIKHLFGVPLLDDPLKNVKIPENLKPALLTALQIQNNEKNLIPAHCHLYSVQLQLKKKKIIFSVPPPESFKWTCKKLSLIHNDVEVYESVLT